MNITPNDILKFWFEELSPNEWFTKNDDLDEMIRGRFFQTLLRAEKGELVSWRKTPEGRLAEIIVLDQFSRNIFRGQGEAFRNDGMALLLAQEMRLLGLDKDLTKEKRIFCYMPFMHSESRDVHEEAVKAFVDLGDEDSLRYEKMHKEIIDAFGRFPHRNKIMGRITTPREKEFLEHHSGF